MDLAPPSVTQVTIDVELVEEGRHLVVDLLNTLRAYDVMSESSKILVYDTALPFKQAYHGLVEHDTNCAPLWDSKSGVFAGCFSMSDVVDFMRTLYTPSPPELGMPPKQAIMTAFAQLTITTWRAYALSLDPSQLVSPEIQRSISRRLDGEAAAARGESLGMSDTNRVSGSGNGSSGGGGGGSGGGSGSGSGSGGGGPGRGGAGLGGRPDRPRLIAVDPEESLFTISRKLRRHNIHSMPVLDVEQNAVVSVLTHRHLLSYLLPRFVDSRRLFDQPICLLGLGVFDAQVVVVPEGASIISLLNVMWERKISAVPVVNELGQVVDLYGRKDISFLANDPTFMVLDAPVGEVRKAQIKMMGPNTPVLKCSRYDTLHRVLELLAAVGEYSDRLVCVDEHGRCTGIVTITDIFSYFCSPGPVAWKTEAWPELAVTFVGGQPSGGGNGGKGLSQSNSLEGQGQASIGLSF